MRSIFASFSFLIFFISYDLLLPTAESGLIGVPQEFIGKVTNLTKSVNPFADPPSNSKNPATSSSDSNNYKQKVNLSKFLTDFIDVTTTAKTKDDNITPRVTQSTISDGNVSTVPPSKTDSNNITPRVTQSTISDGNLSTVSTSKTDSNRASITVPVNCVEGKVFDADIGKCVELA